MMGDVTETLAEFLLAAIADDEAMASVAGEAAERGITLPPENKAAVIVLSEPEVMMFHATFDPARVLAECEAKRQQIDHLIRFMEGDYAPWNEDQLKMMAAVYADRPGFREEWRM